MKQIISSKQKKSAAHKIDSHQLAIVEGILPLHTHTSTFCVPSCFFPHHEYPLTIVPYSFFFIWMVLINQLINSSFFLLFVCFLSLGFMIFFSWTLFVTLALISILYISINWSYLISLCFLFSHLSLFTLECSPCCACHCQGTPTLVAITPLPQKTSSRYVLFLSLIIIIIISLTNSLSYAGVCITLHKHDDSTPLLSLQNKIN